MPPRPVGSAGSEKSGAADPDRRFTEIGTSGVHRPIPMRRVLLITGPFVLVACCYAATYTTARDEQRRHDEQLAAVARVADQDRARVEQSLAEQCAAVARSLAEQTAGELPTSLIRPPFVLVSDAPVDRMQALLDETIRPLSSALWRAYFDVTPKSPIALVLLSNESSYRRLARQLDGYDPISYDGYYQKTRRRLVLNLASGEGTLAHELCHALAACDCPDLPEWVDEGLAALHEEARYSPDRLLLVGEPNWRCRIVRDALSDDRLPTISSLATSASFRGDDEGLKYAFSRTLCRFLQSRGLLSHFYRKLRRNVATDPTGLETLQAVLGVTSSSEIDTAIRNWLLVGIPESEQASVR